MGTKTEKHTPGPWKLAGNTIYDQEGKGVAQSAWEVMAEFNIGDHAIFLERSEKEEGEARANAEFIVRACNAHDELVRELNQTIADMQGICSLTNDDVLSEIAVQVADRLAVAVGRRPKEEAEA